MSEHNPLKNRLRRLEKNLSELAAIHSIGNAASLAQEVADTVGEAASIIERLPETADNVLIAPTRDAVYYPCRNTPKHTRVAWGQRNVGDEQGDDLWEWDWWVGGASSVIRVSDCYSAKEAALAASERDAAVKETTP